MVRMNYWSLKGLPKHLPTLGMIQGCIEYSKVFREKDRRTDQSNFGFHLKRAEWERNRKVP